MSSGGAARPSGGAGMGNSVDSTTRRATGRMNPKEVTRAWTAMTSDLETFSRRERFVDSLVSLLPRMLTQAMTARTDQREEDEN
ncbi:hypothetical protein GW17_00038156 [Ensete ventricosum]|nr:hypothetical protein GW17_00038156 [Ensete ventricosum]